MPRWKGQTIESPLRFFVNIITAITYNTEWASLSRVAEIITHNQDTNSDTELN